MHILIETVLTQSSETLYLPILERRTKSVKLYLTLNFLEQWKFFFHLPISLQQSISKVSFYKRLHLQGEYDIAVRDYKKGKYLMQSSKDGGNTNRSPTGTTLERDALLPKNHLKIFDKVWNEAEKILDDMRSILFKQLTMQSQSIDTQEKIIR